MSFQCPGCKQWMKTKRGLQQHCNYPQNKSCFDALIAEQNAASSGKRPAPPQDTARLPSSGGLGAYLSGIKSRSFLPRHFGSFGSQDISLSKVTLPTLPSKLGAVGPKTKKAKTSQMGEVGTKTTGLPAQEKTPGLLEPLLDDANRRDSPQEEVDAVTMW